MNHAQIYLTICIGIILMLFSIFYDAPVLSKVLFVIAALVALGGAFLYWDQ